MYGKIKTVMRKISLNTINLIQIQDYFIMSVVKNDCDCIILQGKVEMQLDGKYRKL